MNKLNVVTTSLQGDLQKAPSCEFTNERLYGLQEISIDPEVKYQSILGFGAAFTDASVCNINSLLPEQKEEMMDMLFSPDKMNMNVCRTTVAQSDYGRVPYTYDDTPDDMELKDFSIDYDREYIIPFIRRARELNPEMFLFSSTWSPPGWMKSNKDVFGGWMKNEYLEVYARYYLKYLQAYAAEGIEIKALTAQNESETDQQGKMPACYWHPDTEAAFLKDHLVPLLEKNGLKPLIWIMDHNYDLWKRAKFMLDDPGLKKVVDGVAFHPYGGTADTLSLLHEAHPGVNMYFTELGVGPGPRADYATDFCKFAKRFSDALNNWCRCITLWNFSLNEEGGPNIGPQPGSGGMININTKTHGIIYSGQFRAINHFCRFIKRGAHRIACGSISADFSHSAFLNPDGSYVLVLANPGQTRTIQVKLGDKYARIALLGDSVSTVTW